MQVIVSEKDFTSFTSASGKKLDPVKTEEGFHFELHTMVLNGKARYWVYINEPFILEGGGKWRRMENKTFTSCGTAHAFCSLPTCKCMKLEVGPGFGAITEIGKKCTFCMLASTSGGLLVGSKLKAASNHVWEEEDEGEDQCLREQYQHYSLSRLSQGAVEKMFRVLMALICKHRHDDAYSHCVIIQGHSSKLPGLCYLFFGGLATVFEGTLRPCSHGLKVRMKMLLEVVQKVKCSNPVHVSLLHTLKECNAPTLTILSVVICCNGCDSGYLGAITALSGRVFVIMLFAWLELQPPTLHFVMVDHGFIVQGPELQG
eukprot:scaffold51364_cov19-Tisochrysis_lutea.AAC.1